MSSDSRLIYYGQTSLQWPSRQRFTLPLKCITAGVLTMNLTRLFPILKSLPNRKASTVQHQSQRKSITCCWERESRQKWKPAVPVKLAGDFYTVKQNLNSYMDWLGKGLYCKTIFMLIGIHKLIPMFALTTEVFLYIFIMSYQAIDCDYNPY